MPVYLQCGNRDFLLGERFAQACRATLLPDSVVHDVQGTPTLLMHGDLLCTDDVEYQRFRAYRQDPEAPPAISGTALFRPPHDRRGHALRQPPRDGDQERSRSWTSTPMR